MLMKYSRFNKIKWTTPKVATVGAQLPINKLTDQLRGEVARSGFSEALTFALVNNIPLVRPTITSPSARMRTALPISAVLTMGRLLW